MVRSIVSKVMWVGRATVFLVGLAVILALVFGAASTALGADGDFFKVGRNNLADSASKLIKSGAGPALDLRVDSGAPLKVNSDRRVARLNADKLDGKHAGEIGVNGLERALDRSATNSEYLKTATALCPQGKVAVGTGANISTDVLSYANHVVIDEIRPSTSSVYVMAYEHEPTTTNWRVEATAICATAP